ncbi:TLD domain-containing protein 2 [Lonchura striata]
MTWGSSWDQEVSQSPRDSRTAKEVTATGHHAPVWRGVPTHAPQRRAGGTRSGPPRAATGRWHPQPPCHAPVAREGPARLDINPGAVSRAPWRRGASAPETAAMRGLRYHYQLLPDQDEELPMGYEDPAGEGQQGWEGAPAAAEEEPCTLVLSTPSSILRDRELEELGAQLPPRLTQQPWHLLYSTGRDGFSLRTLYRSGARPDSPALLLVRDTEAQAFGAFSASAIRSSSGFYGTGETFLFSFCPELKVFRWTGRNDFFVKGDVNLLMVGGGSGRFGLWLDGDLHHGGSQPCETFDNETLSHQEEFCIQDLEMWGLA